MNHFPTLKLEGGLISADLIDQIADGSAPGQKPVDFGMPRGHLSDEIAAAWGEARVYWSIFKGRAEGLDKSDAGTSLTRDRWLIPFFSLLGYELDYIPRAALIDGKSYNLSHRLLPSLENRTTAGGDADDYVPLHLVGFRQSLERRPESGVTRLAPHALMQEYLNRSEHLWGLVSNGYTLRLLRNSLLMRRLSYIEFDLQQMMESDQFADFALLYRLLHRSRLPQGIDDSPQCLLEQYHRQTIEQGGRVRDRLRDGVEAALKTLANGLISHSHNIELRRLLQAKELTAEAFYQELLRLVYRLLFLMVAEERGLVSASPAYLAHYSISRLRRLAEARAAYNQQTDAWLALQTTFELFRDEQMGTVLGVTALNGDLFSHEYTRHLDSGVSLNNQLFYTALWHLSMYREERTPWRRVNYAALDVEELGSVYESLLDYHPVLLPEGSGLRFDLSFGSERKTTGSYYTPPELVQELIRSALEPVIQERLDEASKSSDPKVRSRNQEKALLSIKICDPASGSGHFLLAAARRLGRELAKVRAGEDEPGPESQRQAIREIIAHCIYAVDKNPLAVDLCKVALWIESHAPGKPLAFLDDRVRWGDSLVGVLDSEMLKQGVPDEAFEPLSGDDRALARSLKARNRDERAGQMGLLFESEAPVADTLKARQAIVNLPDDTPDQVRRKAEAYQKLHAQGSGWWQVQTLYHLWTAAFYQPYRDRQEVYITTDAIRRYQRTHTLDGRLVGKAWQAALDPNNPFFHWTLEFPEVFAQDGFDVILCNPPWERIKLQEQEYFATKDAEIAQAPNAAARKRLIVQLEKTNPALWQEYHKALRSAEAQSQFLRHTGRYPLTGRGDINTYSVFSELFTLLVNPRGRIGVVVPTGIATDDTNKYFFAEQVDQKRIVSLFDFENREAIFPGVHRSYKFCLLTLSKTPVKHSQFIFFATNVSHLKDEQRRFSLAPEEIALFNPNTRTMQIFRTRADTELTRLIYTRLPVLISESYDHSGKVTNWSSPYGCDITRTFDMARFSQEAKSISYLLNHGFMIGNGWFNTGNSLWIPIIESKTFWILDHRFGTYEGVSSSDAQQGKCDIIPSEEKANPNRIVVARYWLPKSIVDEYTHWHKEDYWVGYRDVTNATNERTMVPAILPRNCSDYTVRLIWGGSVKGLAACCLCGNLSSLVFDYVARQSVAGIHFSDYIIKQLPIIPYEKYRKIKSEYIVGNRSVG